MEQARPIRFRSSHQVHPDGLGRNRLRAVRLQLPLRFCRIHPFRFHPAGSRKRLLAAPVDCSPVPVCRNRFQADLIPILHLGTRRLRRCAYARDRHSLGDLQGDRDCIPRRSGLRSALPHQGTGCPVHRPSCRHDPVRRKPRRPQAEQAPSLHGLQFHCAGGLYHGSSPR